MDEAIFRAPIIRTLATGMKAIPIASARADAAILERAFEMTAAALRDGELVCILDTHFNSTWTFQDVGRLNCAVFGECIRPVFSVGTAAGL